MCIRDRIVGEIMDETDADDEMITLVEAGVWRADGRFPTDDAIELGWPVTDSDDYETIAGWLPVSYTHLDVYKRQVFHFALRRQHDDGHIGRVADDAANALAGYVGQHKVKDDQIEVMLGEFIEGILAIEMCIRDRRRAEPGSPRALRCRTWR